MAHNGGNAILTFTTRGQGGREGYREGRGGEGKEDEEGEEGEGKEDEEGEGGEGEGGGRAVGVRA